MALVLATGGLLHVSASTPAVAQVQAQTGFTIPDGSLSGALTTFGRQADLQVTYLASVVAGKASPGFSGTASPQQALSAILQGSGLVYTFTNDRTVAISAPEPVSFGAGGGDADDTTFLEPVTVTTSAGGNVGIVATASGTGAKSGLPIKDTPQAVNVVTRDQMDIQGSETVVQALRYTPGVVAQYGDADARVDWFSVRGFRPGRYLDGLRLPFGARGYAQPKIEPYGLESAEVLKGPTSVLYGQNLPGGLINMVSKRPRDEEIREIELQAGSYDRFQTAFDFGGRLNDEGTILYRLTGLGRISDTQYNYVDEKKGFFAPSLTFAPDDATSLTLYGQYQKVKSNGGGGFPTLTANGTLYTDVYPELPRDTFVGEPDYDKFELVQTWAGYELDHEFNDTWAVKQNLRYAYVNADTQRVAPACLAGMVCDPAALMRYAWAFPERSHLFTVDNQAIGTFSLGETEHSLLLGLDYSYETSHFEESQLTIITTPFDAYDPVYGATPISRPPAAMRIDQERSQLGLYAQDQIEWDNFVWTLGGRYDWADTKTRTRNASGDATVDQNDGKFTWRTGLVYNFDNGISPYAGYSTSFNPQSGTDRNGNPFNPTTGEQFEVGLRYVPFNEDISVSVSAYQLTQNDVLTPDPANINYNTQTGEVRLRGIEVEGKAELTDGLSLIASYAYTDSKITEDNPDAAGASDVGNRLAFVPRHQASLWLDYTVQSDTAWGGLSFGGGARYMGQTYGDNANVYDIPDYTLFDAAIRYDFAAIDQKYDGLTGSLNVSNLFDKKYVSTCIAATGCNWGDGRTIYGTLKYSW
ncbi:TonB-dependent siderophore receptor [Martelella mangrovi]|uniref:Iron complex outermembrane receptor protein n=1 Tax=Martelella mangrovi TaxID=1397477 RepID=A0ABV2IFQ0_9HYPH